MLDDPSHRYLQSRERVCQEVVQPPFHCNQLKTSCLGESRQSRIATTLLDYHAVECVLENAGSRNLANRPPTIRLNAFSPEEHPACSALLGRMHIQVFVQLIRC